MSAPVQLYVYDLSNGMAKAFSGSLLNKNIEAVYHTSVVVHGIEFYYGSGINQGVPAQSDFGTPVEKLPMGTTLKTVDEVHAFLSSVGSEFSENAYDLIKNNCNHFSNKLLGFLCDKAVPEHILNQGKEFLETDLGKMFAPLLQNGLGAQLNPAIALQQQPQQQAPLRAAEPKQKSSLYLLEPLAFMAKEPDMEEGREAIVAKMSSVVGVSESLIFNDEYASLIAKITDKQECTVKEDTVKLFAAAFDEFTRDSSSVDDGLLAHCLDFLSCIALSNSTAVIAEHRVLEPFTLLLKYPVICKADRSKEAFVRYLTNWFAQIPGMKDLRARGKGYFEFVSRLILSGKESRPVALMCYRCLYNMSRVFQVEHIAEVRADLLPILCNAICEGAKAISENPDDRKKYIATVNLASGALGRCVLTMNDRAEADGFFKAAQKALRVLDLSTIEAPCTKDLRILMRLTDSLNENEELY